MIPKKASKKPIPRKRAVPGNRERMASAEQVLSTILPVEQVKKKASNFEFLSDWARVVGPEFSDISQLERLDKGLLTIRVIDPAWIQEMSLHRSKIIQNISEMGYAGAVSQITFVSGNPKNFR